MGIGCVVTMFILAPKLAGLMLLGGTPGANVPNIVFAAPPTADLVGGGGPAGTTTVSILPYAIGTTVVGFGGTIQLVTRALTPWRRAVRPA